MSVLLSLKEVPASKLSGLSNLAGNRIEYTGGEFNFSPVANIVNATGATVTLEPDTAYKITATTSAVTLNANAPASGQWGLEGHIELFVAGTGYVVTGSNVVLANALEPDSVNNCTVRFHDGFAIISVEDHIAGYIVTVNATSGQGSLPYALSVSASEYVAFDASLNGQTLDLAGATTYAGEKHVVGNGYTETIISGGITCTSKTTFSNLSMQDVAVNGGTMTLGDVNIPSGSTVAVSGGGLAIEKVTGLGGIIDLNGDHIVAKNGTYLKGVTITNGGNTTGMMGGAFSAVYGANMTLSDCLISGNKGQTNLQGAGGYIAGQTTVSIAGCTFAAGQYVRMVDSGSTIEFKGSNTFLAAIATNHYSPGAAATILIEEGAMINVTGTTEQYPLYGGSSGKIIVAGGDPSKSFSFINKGGSTVTITGGTYFMIDSAGVVTTN